MNEMLSGFFINLCFMGNVFPYNNRINIYFKKCNYLVSAELFGDFLAYMHKSTKMFILLLNIRGGGGITIEANTSFETNIISLPSKFKTCIQTILVIQFVLFSKKKLYVIKLCINKQAKSLTFMNQPIKKAEFSIKLLK